jgi:hypothetical protein
MGIAVQCLGLVLLASAGATPWDAVQAFHTAANPSEAWSYGYTVPGTQPFTLQEGMGQFCRVCSLLAGRLPCDLAKAAGSFYYPARLCSDFSRPATCQPILTNRPTHILRTTYAYRDPPNDLQRLHDLRVVRASEIQGQPAMDRDLGKLVDRFR